MTSIKSLYEKAIADKTLFQKQTGVKLEAFEQLAPYFKITCARDLTNKEQLFAILYSQKEELDATSIGKLIPFKNCKRDGQNFLDQATTALTTAREKLLKGDPIESNKQKSKKPIRVPTTFKENKAMSLALNKSRSLNPELIKEHAQRRVDLFFYTLIAYYNTKLTITIGDTKEQHGTGTVNAPACHSAILPSLWDTKHSKSSSNNSETSLLDGTHFNKSLNSTVQLDVAVNYFETHHLEGKNSGNTDKMRGKSLVILNRVSQGVITPTEGLVEFLTTLHDYFDECEDTYLNTKELATSPSKSRKFILECQKKGSFELNWHENKGYEPTLNDDYVNSILKPTPLQINALQKQPDETNASYLKRYKNDEKKMHEACYLVIKTEMGLIKKTDTDTKSEPESKPKIKLKMNSPTKPTRSTSPASPTRSTSTLGMFSQSNTTVQPKRKIMLPKKSS